MADPRTGGETGRLQLGKVSDVAIRLNGAPRSHMSKRPNINVRGEARTFNRRRTNDAILTNSGRLNSRATPNPSACSDARCPEKRHAWLNHCISGNLNLDVNPCGRWVDQRHTTVKMPLVNAFTERRCDIRELVTIVHPFKFNLRAVDDWRRCAGGVCGGNQVGEIELHLPSMA